MSLAAESCRATNRCGAISGALDCSRAGHTADELSASEFVRPRVVLPKPSSSYAPSDYKGASGVTIS